MEGLPQPRLGQSKIEMGVTMPQGSSPSGGCFHPQPASDQLARTGRHEVRTHGLSAVAVLLSLSQLRAVT